MNQRIEEPLELRHEESGYRHYLAGRAVHAGDSLEILTHDDRWIVGRYEWSFRPDEPASVMHTEDSGFIAKPDSILRWPG